MITTVTFTNFAGFRNLTATFSPKVNIIIGENGTGKTHLLKAAYAMCFAASQPHSTKAETSRTITQKLLRLFRPLDQKLGRLRHQDAEESASLSVHFASDKQLAVSFNATSRQVALTHSLTKQEYEGDPLFIPTKEVLSFISGIADKGSDTGTLEALFDDTYLDLCRALLGKVTALQADRLDLDPRFGTVFPSLVNSIRGKYEFQRNNFCFRPGLYIPRAVSSGRKYAPKKTETIFKPIARKELSNNMTAEGFRKIGILQQLLANEALNPGESGPLFWDEPESNMNPKLMRLLVQTILDLSRSGQQIILASHDYVLLKWFDLLTDKSKDDHIRFHSLSRDANSDNIALESADSYQELNSNAIAATFSDLYDSEIDRALGGNQK